MMGVMMSLNLVLVFVSRKNVVSKIYCRISLYRNYVYFEFRMLK